MAEASGGRTHRRQENLPPAGFEDHIVCSDRFGKFFTLHDSLTAYQNYVLMRFDRRCPTMNMELSRFYHSSRLLAHSAVSARRFVKNPTFSLHNGDDFWKIGRQKMV